MSHVHIHRQTELVLLLSTISPLAGLNLYHLNRGKTSWFTLKSCSIQRKPWRWFTQLRSGVCVAHTKQMTKLADQTRKEISLAGYHVIAAYRLVIQNRKSVWNVFRGTKLWQTNSSLLTPRKMCSSRKNFRLRSHIHNKDRGRSDLEVTCSEDERISPNIREGWGDSTANAVVYFFQIYDIFRLLFSHKYITSFAK